MKNEDRVIRQLVTLGESYDSIRVMLLTSSRCVPDARVDIFSDYDVEIFVRDPEPFGKSDQWFEALGTVLVTYREEPSQRYGGYTRLVQYEDGKKIDFGVAPIDELKKISGVISLPDHYDIGYEVILDKDGVSASFAKPTYKAFIPAIPSETEYAGLVNEFWWDSTYVSKYIWRDDIMAIKFMLDNWLKGRQLRRMLEWSIEIQRGWGWKPGNSGRDIKRALDLDAYTELAGTYVGVDLDELWNSFFRTTALFRNVAVDVADKLGYQYPHDLDRRVTVYHETVRKLDRQAISRDDLARLLKEAYDQS
jgi:aminoglycoside 6-adenylyltransferase